VDPKALSAVFYHFRATQVCEVPGYGRLGRSDGMYQFADAELVVLEEQEQAAKTYFVSDRRIESRGRYIHQTEYIVNQIYCLRYSGFIHDSQNIIPILSDNSRNCIACASLRHDLSTFFSLRPPALHQPVPIIIEGRFANAPPGNGRECVHGPSGNIRINAVMDPLSRPAVRQNPSFPQCCEMS